MDETSKYVLIVDDAHLVRLYYRNSLERSGYTVGEAQNGLEALEKLLTKAADVLLVDINMPQMDGLTFLSRLRRQRPSIRSIPALVLSTESAVHDKNAARAAGANFYLIKPVSPEILTSYVSLLCGKRQWTT